MPKNTVSRRSFIAVPAAAAAGREPVVVQSVQVSTVQAQAQPVRIVTMYRFEPHEVEKIRAAAGNAGVELVLCATRDEFHEKLRDAEVAYGNLNGTDLDYAPQLKWLQWGAAGVEALDEKVRRSPVVITNYARTFAPAISETAIGLLLALTRGLARYYMPQFQRREWKPVGSPKTADHVELSGRTMAIVGMGGIGSAVARRAHYGFDMRIIATDAKPLPKPEYVAELHDPTYFPHMVPQADVLVSAAPETPQTTRMFNEAVFHAMKPGAYFLALSRGKLFDDLALARALKEGRIAGAGLDVFPQEPPPKDHPIYDCPNVVMTMHTSGWSTDRQVRLIDLFADNVRRYIAGLPLVNVVDKQRGY